MMLYDICGGMMDIYYLNNTLTEKVNYKRPLED